jgi:stage II sporulation protein P
MKRPEYTGASRTDISRRSRPRKDATQWQEVRPDARRISKNHRAASPWMRLRAVLLTAAVIAASVYSSMYSADRIKRAAGSAALLSAKLSVPQGGEALLRGSGPQKAVVAQPKESAASAAGSAASAASSISGTKPVRTVRLGAQTGGKYENYLGICVYRQTAQVSSADIRAQLAAAFSLGKISSDAPQVLIIHTHTTEAFIASENGRYDPTAATRDTDRERSVVRVGGEIEKYLTKNGIKTIHDTNYYDYPVFDGAYTRSLAATQEYLEKYPSIKVVLDIHRDIIQESDGTRLRPTVKISGKNAAQIAIVAACGEPDSSLTVPQLRQNYTLALRIQQQLVHSYPGLARPLELVDKQYNQQACPGSLMVEIGTDVSSLDEAVFSGQLFGQAVSQVLKKMK